MDLRSPVFAMSSSTSSIGFDTPPLFPYTHPDLAPSHTIVGINAEVRTPVTGNLDNDQTAKPIVVDVRLDDQNVPRMVKESTVWDVYNNEARKVDSELVKDWTASLNFLLIFTAIFAAVLTAFIIESKKMLEPDHAEVLVGIAIQFLNNRENLSNTSFVQPVFKPSSAAISVNCWLFASLGTSLVAALASVVALQWVANYDAAITRGGSSAEDRAKRRQFRFAGIVKWKMSEIIAALPLLLYSSVILFWVGAVQWMWNLDYIVGCVVAVGPAVAVLFYASTTLLGSIYDSSPFRTPLSKGLNRLRQWFISQLGDVISLLSIQGCLLLFTRLYQSTWAFMQMLVTSNTTPEDRGSIESGFYGSPETGRNANVLLKASPATGAPMGRTRLVRPIAPAPVVAGELAHIGDTQRREFHTSPDQLLHQAALAWLAEQLPISVDSFNRLQLFVSGMLALSEEVTLSPYLLKTPWIEILDFLSAHHMQNILGQSTTNDYEGLDGLLNFINCSCVRNTLRAGPDYEQNPQVAQYWYQHTLRPDQVKSYQAINIVSTAFLLARDVPIPSLGSNYELRATCKLIRWRNLAGLEGISNARHGIWTEIFRDIQHYSVDFFVSCLQLYQKSTIMRVERVTKFRRVADTTIIAMIIKQALDRPTTIREAVAIAQVFANIIAFTDAPLSNDKSPIPQLLEYAASLEVSSEENKRFHHAITLLVARAAKLGRQGEWPKWTRWIVMMLWIGGTNAPVYWVRLKHTLGNGELWGKTDMTLGGVHTESTHVAEIMEILAMLIKAPYSGFGYRLGTLWINFDNPLDKRAQLMRMLVAFDKLLRDHNARTVQGEPGLHRSLVALICYDMRLSGMQWQAPFSPSEEPLADSLSKLQTCRQDLEHTNDQCLKILGAFACSVQLPSGLVQSPFHRLLHNSCLRKLRRVVFRDISINDSPELWAFRAAMGPLDISTMDNYFQGVLDDPEQLSCLIHLLKYPTQCHRHGVGSRHMAHVAFHLYQHARTRSCFVGKSAGLNSYLNSFNPILGMLALSSTQDLSDLNFKPGSADLIWTICKLVKGQPTQFLCLLVDIVAVDVSRDQVAPNEAQVGRLRLPDLSMTLECVERALALPDDKSTMPLLRPLASGLRLLPDNNRAFDGTEGQRRAVRINTEAICSLLKDKADTFLQHRSLACARSVRANKSARAWRSMYVD